MMMAATTPESTATAAVATSTPIKQITSVSNNDVYDYLFKFLIIGSAGTGKSCILHRFIENKFKEDTTHTIGVEFGSKVINVNSKTVKLQIWDTAGQERFRSVTRSYYRGAAGALLVYDISSRDSFNAVQNWLSDARNLASPSIIIILVGNKKDLEAQRQVSFQEGTQFAHENDLIFLETSSLSGENIDESFLRCARTILSSIDAGDINPNRLGSGIQYGDMTLHHLQRATNDKQGGAVSNCASYARCNV